MDSYNTTEGHLVIFDKDEKKTWEEKISHEVKQEDNKAIHVWRM